MIKTLKATEDWIDKARKKREKEAVIKYGQISPENDPRYFVQEMVEELLDALNYCEWARGKGEISFDLWRVTDRSIRFALSLFESGRALPEAISQRKGVL